MLPSSPGLYVLFLRLPAPQAITVGRIGCSEFPSGWYAYVGSARGPGGLAARVSRHRRRDKVLHWHVDYLRAHAEPLEVWFVACGAAKECAWAAALAALPGATVPVPRFGSSDCRCHAHLVHFCARPDARTFADRAGVCVSVEVLTGASAADRD